MFHVKLKDFPGFYFETEGIDVSRVRRDDGERTYERISTSKCRCGKHLKQEA